MKFMFLSVSFVEEVESKRLMEFVEHKKVSVGKKKFRAYWGRERVHDS